jgi:hypothetical protein
MAQTINGVELPALNYGAVKAARPPIRELALWALLGVLSISAIISAFLVPREPIPLGYTEIMAVLATLLVLGWLISFGIWAIPTLNFENDYRYYQIQYAKDVIVPWAQTTYRVDLAPEEAVHLLHGYKARVYLANDNQHKLVELAGSSNLREYAANPKSAAILIPLRLMAIQPVSAPTMEELPRI